TPPLPQVTPGAGALAPSAAPTTKPVPDCFFFLFLFFLFFYSSGSCYSRIHSPESETAKRPIRDFPCFAPLPDLLPPLWELPAPAVFFCSSCKAPKASLPSGRT